MSANYNRQDEQAIALSIQGNNKLLLFVILLDYISL